MLSKLRSTAPAICKSRRHLVNVVANIAVAPADSTALPVLSVEGGAGRLEFQLAGAGFILRSQIVDKR